MPVSIQNITINPARPRWTRKLSLLLMVVLPLVWYIGRREWDFRSAYSGVVVEKGMDYSLIFGCRTPDLYLVLRDDSGQRSKRYVCSRICSTAQLRQWSDIGVGSFVVKNKGYGEFPYEPGKKPPARAESPISGWVFFAMLLALGIVAYFRLRAFWRAV